MSMGLATPMTTYGLSGVGAIPMTPEHQQQLRWEGTYIIQECVCVFIYIYVYVYMYMNVCVYIYMHIHIYIYIYIYMHIYIYIYIYIYVNIQPKWMSETDSCQMMN
jgi:hypothetical protein